jgi:hypothetical protein
MVTASIRRISLAGEDESLVDLIPKHIRFLGSDYLPRHWKIAQPHSGRHREFAQTSNPWPSPKT